MNDTTLAHRESPSAIRAFRIDYFPPLMVYLAAGLSGLTGIASTFIVKDYLGLSASLLAALGFWAGIPWALKMPMGHLVDLFWRWKSWFVIAGAGLIALSFLIVQSLLLKRTGFMQWLTPTQWYICSALLGPIGLMLQDTVADAMTVEAVPHIAPDGTPHTPEQRRAMNTSLQTYGRIAIVGGGILVSLFNTLTFHGIDPKNSAHLHEIYVKLYEWALTIPMLSLAGIALAAFLRRTRGPAPESSTEVKPNWWILGGSAIFVALTIGIGLSDITYNEELIFGGSSLVIGILMWRLVRELAPAARQTLLGTAILIFLFRAMPGPGAGATWWMIDKLGFDQAFMARLSLVASVLTLIGLFAFRRLMAERSIAYVIGFLSITGFLLGLPTLGMYYGLHEWTSVHTAGLVDARMIALIDTALESPLAQISMVPMLAWIANSAPSHLKATYFAVMASFTNLALSASQLGTKYLNELFVVTREVRGADGMIATPADYSSLGILFLIASALTLLPLATIALIRIFKINTD